MLRETMQTMGLYLVSKFEVLIAWIHGNFKSGSKDMASSRQDSATEVPTKSVIGVKDSSPSTRGIDWEEALSQAEVEEIMAQFMKATNASGRLVFWSGMPRERAQQWADDHDMLTLSTMMGPLMDKSSSRCPKHRKGRKQWRKYIKGASSLFAKRACDGSTVRVLLPPPSGQDCIRDASTYRTIEEPILKGSIAQHCATQINFIHPMIDRAEDFEYQIWPESHLHDWLRLYGMTPTKVESRSQKVNMHADHHSAADRSEMAVSGTINPQPSREKVILERTCRDPNSSIPEPALRPTATQAQQQKTTRSKKNNAARKRQKRKQRRKKNDRLLNIGK